MADWLVETGIGEQRAILIRDGRIIGIEIDRDSDGPRAGAVLDARLGEVDRALGRAHLVLDAPGAPLATLAQVPRGVSVGAVIRVRVMRAALREAGRVKPARAEIAPADEPLMAGPIYTERAMARGGKLHLCKPHGVDRFEAAGWSELCDAARTGVWPFAGGTLVITAAPAMTLIDVDGGGDPASLARAGALAAAEAIDALGIGGSIGIDFPTVASRAVRQEIAAIIDTRLSRPFECTAINGFGLMQIVRRRTGPSLIEYEQFAREESDALRLIRMAERAQGAGRLTLTVRSGVAAQFDSNPGWLATLQARTGRAVEVRIDNDLEGCGHAQ